MERAQSNTSGRQLAGWMWWMDSRQGRQVGESGGQVGLLGGGPDHRDAVTWEMLEEGLREHKPHPLSS